MTANFKKRMLTDYTVRSTTSETEDVYEPATSETPLKRLRITARTLHLDTRDINDPSQARSAVSDLRLQTETLADNFVTVSAEDLLDVTEKLRDIYIQFKDPELRCMVLQTIGVLLSFPNGIACLTSLRPFFLKTLCDNPSVTIRTVLLRMLLQAGSAHQQERDFTAHIAVIVDKCIKDLHLLNKPVLLAGCLDVVGELMHFREDTRRYILALWGKFAGDTANEVRASAFRMLRNLCFRGFLLEFKMYKSICGGLEDLCVNVRSCAMDLIFRLGQQDKLRQVQSHQAGETLNLVDDVFCKICDRINDWEIEIRAKASQILGMMNGVTIDYINQTVDKKLMSDLRVKVAGHERQKQLFESGEWSSGRKWADDAPKERLQQEDVKLMSIGATGAFVLALEDQFQEVRAPAVISMAQLAAKHPSFGSTCAEFLVDMFNDEIHDVRLNALKMFPLLGQGVDLREDQLEMVLTVLQDADLDIREGLRLILPTLKYSSAKILRLVFDALLTNFNQYPSDHGYICTCLASLGYKNAQFVLEEAVSYLNIHPFLQSVEPKSDDKVYIATMTLVCNAAAVCPEMFEVFRDFHFRHCLLYHYKFPDWFPLLENVGNTSFALKLSQNSDSMSRTGLVSRLSALRRAVSSAPDWSAEETLFSSVGANLHAICEQDTALDTTKSWLELQFRFVRHFIQCLKKYTERAKKVQWTTGTADGMRSQTDEMRTRFTGHSTEDNSFISELALKEKLMVALMSAERSGDLIDLDQVLLSELQELNKAEAASWAGILLEQPRVPEQMIYSVLRSSIPVPALNSFPLKKIKAEIKNPINNEEYPVSIVVGTIHRIPFEAVVEGAGDNHIAGLVICILMPDDRRLLLAVTEKNVTRQNNQLVIKKDIAISLTVWAASAALKIQLGRIIVGKSLQVAGNYQLVQEEDLRRVIVLAGPVSYHVAPVSVKNH